jgi:hypothetical protein
MDLLQTLFQEVANDFALATWTLNAVVGWALIILALVFSAAIRLFGDALLVKWSAQEIAGQGKNETISTKLRKFFFPLFTKDPNEEFKPYIYYWVPLALGMCATLAIGFYISVTDNPIHILIGICLLAAAYIGCAKIAQWQVRNRRW